MSEANARFYVVRVSRLNSISEDWLSSVAFDFGAEGLSEVLSFSQPEGEEDVTTHFDSERTVDCYFLQAPPNEFLQTLAAHKPSLGVETRLEENRDWLEEWKKGFRPFCLVADHWVVPSWCEPPPEATHKIWIDPGMAFGTGTHETTQLVAEWMREAGPSFAGQSLLDVGTGTGILAVLAHQLGFEKISATEIEADSRRVAMETFLANGVRGVEMSEKQVEDLVARFDVVVANIIDGVLVRLQESLKARVKPGGWLVVSGIIGEREAFFLDNFRLPANGDWSIRKEKGDWRLFAGQL